MDDHLRNSGSGRSGRFVPDEPPFLISGVTNWQLNVRPRVWRPSTDIYETEDNYVVRVEIAGMGNSEFSVTVKDNTLSISGVRPEIPERRAFHQMEIHFGDFRVDVEFPKSVQTDKVGAEYHDGFLTVVLPKTLPKQINVGESKAE